MRRKQTIGRRAGWFGLVLALGLSGAAASVAFAQSDTPWLGVMTQSLDDGLRDGMNYRGTGVLVNRVVQGHAADRAGIEKGDVIVSVNGRSIDSPEELSQLIRDARVGQTMSVVVMRDGARRTLSPRLGARPEDEGSTRLFEDEPTWEERSEGDHEREARRMKERSEDHERDARRMKEHAGEDREREARRMKEHADEDHEREAKRSKQWSDMGREFEDMSRSFRDLPSGGAFFNMGRGRLGLRLEDMSGDLGTYFDAPQGSGVLVVEVMKDTPAERAGIRAGDVVVQVEGTKVSDAQDVIDAVRRAPKGRLSVTVLRKGTRRTFEPELEETPMTWRSRNGRDFTMLTPRAPRAPMAPRDRRIIVRRPGEAPLVEEFGDSEATREEMRKLREEIRSLREKVDRLEGR